MDDMEISIEGLFAAITPMMALARFGAEVMHGRVPNPHMTEVDAGAFARTEAAIEQCREAFATAKDQA